MGELTHLARELASVEHVERVTETDTTGIVKFDMNFGEYDPLSSEVVSILGRYDCNLYPQDEASHDYFAVPP